jgi:hypothetical protein
MKQYGIYAAILGFALFLGACSKNRAGDAAALVPADADAVMSLDLGRMSKKIDLDAVVKMEFYQAMLADLRESGETKLAEAFENPAELGIDENSKAYVFVQIPTEYETETARFGIALKIKDTKKLETLTEETEKADGVHYSIKSNTFVAWDDATLLLGVSEEDAAEMQKAFLGFFNQKKSIADNKEAAKALNSGHDLSYFVSLSAYETLLQDSPAAFFLDSDYLKDANFVGEVDFEAGEVLHNFKGNFSKSLTADLKMVVGEGSKTDFSAYLPNKNLGVLATGKLNLKGINQLLKSKNLNGMADTQLNALGISTADLVAAIDGDFALAVNELEGLPTPTVLMLVKIGDRKKLDAILGKVTKMGVLQKSGENIFGVPFGEAQLALTNDFMLLSNNPKFLQKLQKGSLNKTEQVSRKQYESINGVAGFYADPRFLAKNADNLEIKTKNSSISAIFDWKKSSINLKTGSKTNALQGIFELLNEAYLSNQNNETEENSPSEAVEM